MKKLKKRLLGYGYKLRSERFEDALTLYGGFNQLLPNIDAVRQEIKKDKECGNISKNSKPSIFCITISEAVNEKT